MATCQRYVIPSWREHRGRGCLGILRSENEIVKSVNSHVHIDIEALHSSSIRGTRGYLGTRRVTSRKQWNLLKFAKTFPSCAVKHTISGTISGYPTRIAAVIYWLSGDFTTPALQSDSQHCCNQVGHQTNSPLCDDHVMKRECLSSGHCVLCSAGWLTCAETSS